MIPPFIAPPILGPGLHPPYPIPPPGGFPVNFYPSPPLPNAPTYIPPPPPNPNGDQNIERYTQDQKPEPVPQVVQPYLNPQIEAMNKIIKEQEIQNELLEKEL